MSFPSVPMQLKSFVGGGKSWRPGLALHKRCSTTLPNNFDIAAAKLAKNVSVFQLSSTNTAKWWTIFWKFDKKARLH